ncbi:hypothetical protein [Nitrobacter vulgaris]|uniref:hypothetical protein n=1 Tax=Nitrobacter vulgaris TaxID=29421 RepID=UPI001FCCF340|nr:hypothetical protein [Nitrobacter vulgaris]
MVTSPPAAFIKLDQKIEPLFGKYTPAIEDILSVVGRTPGIVSLSHWGDSPQGGKRTQTQRTNHSSLRDILWKTCAKSSALWREYDAIVEAVHRTGVTGGLANGKEMLRGGITNVQSKQTMLAPAMNGTLPTYAETLITIKSPAFWRG